jgi:mRNA degradation ribonuclease J1/J2
MDSEKFPDPRTMKNVKVYKKRQGDLLYSKVDYDKFKAGYLCHWGRNIAKNDQNIVRISEKMGIGGECSSQTENPTDIEKNAWDLAINHIENGIPAYKIREKPEKYILMFSFWDANELFDLSNQNGTIPNSKYIRASCQPFNDEMEIDEERLMNWLDKFGVNYVVDDENEKKFFKRAHVSGHLCKPELKRLIETIKPEILMPVHTKKPEIFEELSKGISKVIIPKYNETYTF